MAPSRPCGPPPRPRGWGSCAGTALPWTRAHLATDPGLLQQVLLDLGALDGTPLVEVDIDVLPKAARVVVADGLGIPKRFRVGRGSRARPAPTQPPAPSASPGPTFQDGGGFQHLLLDPRVLPADGRQELQDQLGALGLPCPRLPAAHDTQKEAGPVTDCVGLSLRRFSPSCFPHRHLPLPHLSNRLTIWTFRGGERLQEFRALPWPKVLSFPFI